MSLPHRLLKAWLCSRLADGSEVDFRWTSGPKSTRLEGDPGRELALIDDVQACRTALDRADRDPVFFEALKAMLAPTRA